jgi:hypothetical protein
MPYKIFCSLISASFNLLRCHSSFTRGFLQPLVHPINVSTLLNLINSSHLEHSFSLPLHPLVYRVRSGSILLYLLHQYILGFIFYIQCIPVLNCSAVPIKVWTTISLMASLIPLNIPHITSSIIRQLQQHTIFTSQFHNNINPYSILL